MLFYPEFGISRRILVTANFFEFFHTYIQSFEIYIGEASFFFIIATAYLYTYAFGPAPCKRVNLHRGPRPWRGSTH